MTPFERHEALNHQTTRHSPDGFVVIEECTECTARFLHNPSIGYPVTMRPVFESKSMMKRVKISRGEQ